MGHAVLVRVLAYSTARARAPDPSGDNDAADVAGDPETGGICTSAFDTCFDLRGGLDQNIYAAPITP